jgi:hypothetical protein
MEEDKMKKVKYIGWNHPREIFEVEDSLVDSLLKTGNYELLGEEKVKKNKSKKKVDYDLNDDGVVDQEDRSLMAKGLGSDVGKE